MGPSRAQAGPKPEIWDPTKKKKIEILKITIRVAQNVGKVWISRKKNLLAPFGALWAQFLRGPEKSEKCQNFAYSPWWANGPYSPGLGSRNSLMELSGACHCDTTEEAYKHALDNPETAKGTLNSRTIGSFAD